ncbi:hypothetical protein AWC02_09900 [Mycolicibacter engbaekii]|uniref:DUF732 domain-containing protein n=1 Tax=Mycolicibacter engbaekii TaxID=188915 RepID=A0A1X1TRG4_9MYCO|nr:DUF732 domain-containing protein [Mycolicibacter engbaekii]ORV47172.1 hypothetical protein AWC02_09900 [Mycolicibacter engbaekii]
MGKGLIPAVFLAVLSCAVAWAPAVSADPEEDQVFFDELVRQGLNSDYDRPVCGPVCEPLRNVLVREAHEVCVGLSEAPKLVPVSVIAHLKMSPGSAHLVINAARQAYCPQSPDPYTTPA